MGKVIVCYSIKNLDHNGKRQFMKKLYGHIDHSKYGRYKYQRKGLLKKDEFEKINNSVMLVSDDVAKKLVKFLKEYPVIFKAFKVKSEIR